MSEDPNPKATTPPACPDVPRVRTVNQKIPLAFLTLDAFIGLGVGLEASPGWGLVTFASLAAFELLVVSLVAVPVGTFERMLDARESDRTSRDITALELRLQSLKAEQATAENTGRTADALEATAGQSITQGDPSPLKLQEGAVDPVDVVFESIRTPSDLRFFLDRLAVDYDRDGEISFPLPGLGYASGATQEEIDADRLVADEIRRLLRPREHQESIP